MLDRPRYYIKRKLAKVDTILFKKTLSPFIIDCNVTAFLYSFLYNVFHRKHKITLYKMVDILDLNLEVVCNLEEKLKTTIYGQKSFGKTQSKEEFTMPELNVYKLENPLVNINSSAFIYKDVLVKESYCIDERFNEGNIYYNGYKNCLVKNFEITYIDGECFFLGGNGSWNWYHFLIEIAPKLLFLKTIKIKKIIVSESVKDYESMKSILNMFVDNSFEIIYCNQFKTYKVETLFYINAISYVPFNMLKNLPFQINNVFHRKEILKKFIKNIKNNLKTESSNDLPDKIYIYRSTHRKAINQIEIIEKLKNKGFAIIDFSNIGLKQQVDLFHNAKLVVGITGAGFSNIIFGKNLSAICMMPNNFQALSVFSNLAELTGVNLYHVYYENSKADHVSNDFEINELELYENIERMDSIN